MPVGAAVGRGSTQPLRVGRSVIVIPHALVGGVTHLLSSSMCAAENCVDGGALGGREWRQLGEPVQMCPSFSLASIHTAADYCYLVELPGIEPVT